MIAITHTMREQQLCSVDPLVLGWRAGGLTQRQTDVCNRSYPAAKLDRHTQVISGKRSPGAYFAK